MPRILIALVLGLSIDAALVSAQARTDGCSTCHAGLPQPNLSAPVKLAGEDIHTTHGFGCVDCHGGDPSAQEKVRAKDPKRGYIGRPAGTQIVTMCARCHSDAQLMRKFAPKQRIDQAAEYATSVHGTRLQAGDRKVATCSTCHHPHGIRQVNDARAPVFPTNVASLCASCHSDTAHMKGYTIAGGAPIPTNQREEYQKSAHFAALTRRNDLAAPTCNDCHGNHGASPPGVGAISNVCGTCHAVFASKFATSAHSQIFDRACVECHGNHAVQPTSDEMLGTSKDAVCVNCHSDQTDSGFVAAGRMRAAIEKLKASLQADTELIGRARNAGMEVSDQELALSEVRTRLTLARTEMHAFDPAAVDQVVNQGLKSLSGVAAAGDRALADLQYRRRGLFISLAVIMIVVVALGLKIRELDRRRELGSDPISKM